MKRTAIILLTLLSSVPAFAQLAFNPQVGISVARLQSLESEEKGKARVGWLAGADFRIGRRFYVQPGIYYWNTSTAYINDSLQLDTRFNRTDIKLNGRIGVNIMDDENAKFRFSVGPSYNILLSNSAKKDSIGNITLSELEKNFNNGLFNIDAAFGIDFWLLTVEAGYSLSLSDAWKDLDYYKSNARYGTFYLNVGIVLGNATSSKR